MNKKTLNALEYDKIVHKLSLEASSDMTRKLILELVPSTDPREIKEALRETSEAKRLISFKGALPLGNFYDIKDSISLAKKGGSLSILELMMIMYNIRIVEEIKSYLPKDLEDIDILSELVSLLEVFKNFRLELEKSIENEDELKDSASPALRDIRRNIVRQKEAIKSKINQIISSADNKDVLQDSIVTIRDGRYVVPVKQEHRGRLRGIIHDQSGSGATLFIEPQIIVTMNNHLKDLMIEEQKEISRIIKELSLKVGEISTLLENNQKILLHLDFVMAKGKLAYKNNFEEPNISENGEIELKNAYHPLIDKERAVASDIVLGKKFSTLIVTGPNTGGKTVTLKTVGLLSLMVQSGLFISAQEGSRFPIYTKIFADIGDEQSIEQSLSTFSSHMTNIVDIIRNANINSLVLLDELGAGTDPTEGAALAISILDRLKEQGCHIIATTHYTELKKYALKTEWIENASMIFDVETLTPTYKLEIGSPGKSNAFEISKKLGLEDDIISRAKSMINKEDLAFEEILESIERDKKQAEDEKEEAILLNIQIKKLKAEIEEKNKKEKEFRENLLKKAREEARNIVKEAEKTAKEVQEELKELIKIESLGERTKKLEESKRKLKDSAGKYREKFIVEINNSPIDINDVKVGDRVKVVTLNQNGEILSLPDSKGNILVQIGNIKMKCKAKDLKLISEGRLKELKKKTAKANYGSLYKGKRMSISQSINVQGEILDDAICKIEKYLDDAILSGLKEVTIIHGRGEGVLQKGIHKFLQDNKQIEAFNFGNYNEGGTGVTIVKFKI